jgi:hypothetical protein
MTYCDIQELLEYTHGHLGELDNAAEEGDDSGVIATCTLAILTLEKLREDLALEGWTECECEGEPEAPEGKPC